VKQGTAAMRHPESFKITLGELIAALMDETLRDVPDEKAARLLIAFMLGELLNGERLDSRSWR